MTTQTTNEIRRPLPGKFVWFEHASRDSKKAQAFYGEVLGWKVSSWGDAYDMILAGDTIETMVGAYIASRDGRPEAHWISYVSVEDVDATAKAAVANGGKLILEPHDLPGVGRAAQIVDPQGAELSIFKNAAGDPPDPPLTEPPPPRRFFWCELHTPDPMGALAFYEKVLGFTREAVDMGPAGAYHILNRDGIGRAGVSSHLQGVPHWLPYVGVDDPDVTISRAKALGGKVLVGPENIQGVGRFGVLQDPTGAVFAVMKALPRARA